MESLILTEVIGGLGVVTLNRPKALNALSLPMIRELHAVLSRWAGDIDVRGVLMRGSGRVDEQGRPHGAVHFCAGGDIRFMHEAAVAGDPAIDDFFTEEYALDHFIHTYPKPIVSWMEGITMGGGMGLVQGTTLRVATEGVRLAMPETRIGLFPDVAGGYFLSRCEGSVGEYLGVVGPHLQVADALTLGLADEHAQSGSLADMLEGFRLQPLARAEELVPRVVHYTSIHGVQTMPDAVVKPHLPQINRHFSLPTMVEIEASLKAEDSEWSRGVLAQMAGHSPLMMCVTLEQIRRARAMSLADVFRMERDIVRNCFALYPGRDGETVEGVRALVIDKDHAPKWRHRSLAEVSRAEVEAFFHSPWGAGTHPLAHLA